MQRDDPFANFTLPRPQSLLLISKAHKLRLKLLISEYRKLYSSAVIGGGGGSAEGKGKAKEGKATGQILYQRWRSPKSK